uniref:Uncharacterized protein n=1 Tax=Arundo donax TaxID=35708 RepID=A0A0A9FI34_ARUDO
MAAAGRVRGGGGVGAAPPAPRSARPCRWASSSARGTTIPRRRRRRRPTPPPRAGRPRPWPCRRYCRRRRWWWWRWTRPGTTGMRRSGSRSGGWSRAGTYCAAETPSSCSACSTSSPTPWATKPKHALTLLPG